MRISDWSSDVCSSDLPMPPMTAPLCAQDYCDLARERVDPAVWAWLESGGADGITARNNRVAFEAIRLCSRVLRPMAGAHTRLKLGRDALADRKSTRLNSSH